MDPIGYFIIAIIVAGALGHVVGAYATGVAIRERDAGRDEWARRERKPERFLYLAWRPLGMALVITAVIAGLFWAAG